MNKRTVEELNNLYLFILWLHGKNPNEEYVYSEAYGCAAFQYFNEMSDTGVKWVTPGLIYINGGKIIEMCSYIQDAVSYKREDCEPRTFGGCLKKSEELASLLGEI
jgi:hypothetical protein